MVNMSQYKSDFLNILGERGYIHQMSDAEGIDALAAKRALIAYVGYDCTAASLHVGSLLSIMMLHWLQETGNRPIALMGGGTTRVGDPSGRDETRKLLTYDEIEANKQSIKQVFSRLMTFGDEATAPSWSTMPNGFPASTTSRCCAMSGATFPSTAC